MEMQAIQVKHLRPTNTKGSRYKAICKSGNYTHPRDYSYGAGGNALTAAERLMEKLGWDKEFEISAMGTLPNGDWAFTIGLNKLEH
jgi:hypothetical protein